MSCFSQPSLLLLSSLRRFAGAMLYYEPAVRLNPQNPDNLSALGGAEYLFGDLKKAIECWTKGLEIELTPDYFDMALDIKRELYGDKHEDVEQIYNYLGRAWREADDPKKAIERQSSILRKASR